MFGLDLDAAFVPLADWTVTSTGNIYKSTTMTWTGSLMTTMTTDVPNTFIKRYVADLSSYTEMDNVPGINAKPTYVEVKNRWFYGVVDSNALHVHEMSSDGTPTGAPIDLMGGNGGAPLAGSLAGATNHVYMMWSNVEGLCRHAAITVPALSNIKGSFDALSCHDPRLVARSDEAFGVFDDGSSLLFAPLTPTGPGNVSLLVPGTAPQIVFEDPLGFWIAYRDTNGKLAVGRFAAADNPLTPVPIQGLSGPIGAYALVQRANKTSLFVIANRGLWVVQLTP